MTNAWSFLVRRTVSAFLLCWLLSISLATIFRAVAKDPASQSIEELEHGIENQHPATFYVLAGKLFVAGKKQEAVFWFYLGQLRYRVYLAANKGNPSGDPALFASLSEEVGRPINEYAFGDIPQLAKTIDAVIAWDRSHPNQLTPYDKYRSEYKEIVAGLVRLRDYILHNADSIRKTRAANHLENRS